MAKTAARKYRSKFEQKEVPPAEARGAEYEPGPLAYPQPDADYTLDLALPNGIAVELKGWLRPEDRLKILRVHRAYPDLDLRVVFQDASNKLYAGSKTSYGEWATRHGLQWATKHIPEAWYDEPVNAKSLAVIDAARARRRQS